jgi:phage baseplate assembly protein W
MGRQNIFGQGLGFPPRVGVDGRLVWSEGEQNVREAIRVILMTEPGERLMREEFGAGLRQYLFEPNTVTTRQLIVENITQAIARWEPRVSIEEVRAEPDTQDARRVSVTILFRLVATQASGRLGMTLQLEG